MRMNALISNVGARVHVKLKKIMAAIEHLYEHYTLENALYWNVITKTKRNFRYFIPCLFLKSDAGSYARVGCIIIMSQYKTLECCPHYE